MTEASYSGNEIAPLQQNAQYQDADRNFAVYGHTFYATGGGEGASTSGVIAADLDTGDQVAAAWTDAFTLIGTDLSDMPVQPGRGAPAVAFYADALP